MLLKDFLKLEKKDIIGKIICFPTDTVYGVGAIIDDNIAVEKIYNLKNRDFDKPLAVLIGSIEDVSKYCKNVSLKEIEYMNKYWPGALTIIFDLKDKLDLRCVCGKSSIGFRMPNSNISLQILKKFGPMATTSVNISGFDPINNLEEIKVLFNDKIDYYIEDFDANISKLSSTVVKIVDGKPVILRQGDIVLEETC